MNEGDNPEVSEWLKHEKQDRLYFSLKTLHVLVQLDEAILVQLEN